MGRDNVRRMMMFLGLVAALALPVGCGGGSSGGGGGVPCAAPDFATGSLDGTWRVVDQEVTDSCDPLGADETEDVTVSLVDSTLTVVTLDGTETFTLCGSTFVVPASPPEMDGGGTNVDHAFTVTINGAGTGFTGTGTWTWTNGTTVCTGSYTLTGTKL